MPEEVRMPGPSPTQDGESESNDDLPGQPSMTRLVPANTPQELVKGPARPMSYVAAVKRDGGATAPREVGADMKHNIALEAYATHMRALAISRGDLDESGMSTRGGRQGSATPRRRVRRRPAGK